ncbi:protein RecA [Listeria innocua FSL S4-378]|nr:protein RecA [Listeria innocua FSL S4-378]
MPTGYGSKKLYAFRYQDIRSVGSVKKKDMNKQLKSAGKWFFNSSPY